MKVAEFIIDQIKNPNPQTMKEITGAVTDSEIEVGSRSTKNMAKPVISQASPQNLEVKKQSELRRTSFQSRNSNVGKSGETVKTILE